MPTIENQSSLHGKTVVVTRPLQQCENMSQQLVKLGAKPILFPCIEILSVNCDDALAALPVSLDEIDMFIFVSSNAVRYGFAQIPLLHKQMQTDKKFAAIGQATATELKNIGVQQILAPDQEFDSESLLSLPAMNNVQDDAVLIIKGAGGRSELFDTLRAREANVYTLDVYRRQLPGNDTAAVLEEIPDAILFSSSESVENMLKIVPTPNHHFVLHSQAIAGHSRIATKVTSLGFEKLPIIAANPSDAEMLAALIGWANRTENYNEH